MRTDRLADQQRMHLKDLEDQARVKYMQDVRDMQTAAAASNMQMLGSKQSSEAAWRRYEVNRDNTDLNKVNASSLNPSATMSMGTSANFRMQ
mgnify:CR=1 FL=1